MNKKSSFSIEVKQEILSHSFSKQAQIALLMPFIVNSNGEFLTTKNTAVEEFDFTIISDFLVTQILAIVKNVFFKMHINIKRCHLKNRVIVKDANLSQLLYSFYVFWKSKLFLNKVNSAHYLAGIFLCCGSLSSLENLQYHLEIQCSNLLLFNSAVALLDKYHFFYKTMYRRKKQIIYFKKSSSISDFLKFIHANNSTLKFENQRVLRDFNNHIQKANNIDVSNLCKTIKSNIKQIKIIRQLINSGKIKKFSEKFQNFCLLKLKNPTASLSQLAYLYHEKYRTKLSRSTMNYYANKLKKINIGYM